MIQLPNFRQIDPNRNALWVGLIIGGAQTITFIYNILSSADQSSEINWQVLLTIVLTILMIASGYFCAWLGYRQRGIVGAVIVSVFINIGGLAQAALISQSELLISVRTFITTILIGLLILPPKWLWRVTFSSMLAAILFALLQLYPNPYQVSIPAENIASFAVVLFVLSIPPLLLMVAVQFNAAPLQNKIAIISLFSVVIAISLVTYFTQSATRTNLENQIGSQLQTLVRSQGFTIGDLLAKGIESLHVLILNDAIDDEIEDANEIYEEMSETEIRSYLLSQDALWQNEIRANPGKGGELVNSVLNHPGVVELNEFISLAQEHVELMLTDRYGGLVATNLLATDYYQGDEIWWQNASRLPVGQAYISSPIVDENTGVTSLILAAPVYNEEGDFAGVLRSTYNIAALIAVLEQVTIGETGEADIYFGGEVLQHIHAGGIEATDADFWQQLLQIENGYRLMNYEEAESLVAVAPVQSTIYNPSIEQTGWKMVIHQHAEEALAPVQAQNQFIIFLSIVIGGIVTGLSVGASQLLVAPIVSLTRAANQLATGNLNARSAVLSNDEIGQLAAGFNDMAASLQQSLLGLEQKVNERTAGLTLAADLGRSLARIRDLDELLNTAVDLIQARYNLYYVQLYLTDAEGKLLLLRSGTGMVGQELLRRSHRLPVGPGSINGRAAAERQPIVVSDTRRSLSFRPNPLLPETRSELALPLILGEQVIGVLDMQSKMPGDLNLDKLAAFESLAGQLAIAINNSRLYSAAEVIRLELEEQTRRLSRQNWDQYWSSVEKQNALGFQYEHGKLSKHTRRPTQDDRPNTAYIPIKLAGHALGSIQLSRQEGERWSDDEIEVLELVGQQVSVQLENLRLLAQAEQYRRDAEDANRRLTGQAWQTYLVEVGVSDIGYTHNAGRVFSDNAPEQPDHPGQHILPLEINNEAIGLIAVENPGNALLAEQQELLAGIAQRLSTHLETLRLQEDNRRALARAEQALNETDALYNVIAELNASRTYENILETITCRSLLGEAEQFRLLSLYDQEYRPGEAPGVLIPAAYSGKATTLAGQYPRQLLEKQVGSLLTDSVHFIAGADDERLLYLNQHAFSNQYQLAALLFVPLQVGERMIGCLLAGFDRELSLSNEDIRRLSTIAGQAAVSVQSLRLLDAAQARARREQLLREAASEINAATSVDEVLRKAAQQIGQALKRPAIVTLNPESSKHD